MRTVYILAVLAGLGLVGVVGWATLGSAQPVFDPPIKDIDKRDAKKPPTIDIPLVIPVPPDPVPVGKPKAKAVDPNRPPVEPIEPPLLSNPIGLPQLPDPLPPQRPVKTPEQFTLKIPDPVSTSIEPSPRIPTNDHLPSTSGPELIRTSKSEPSVSLEWVGPNSVKIGAPHDYVLIVRNTCSQAVEKVAVEVRVPTGVTVVSAESKMDGADGSMHWDIGTLDVRQERRIGVKMLAPQRGDVACQAWVTFSGMSVMNLRVREPKLQVKLHAPERTLVGDPANFSLTVSNPGDHPTDRVKITAMLAEGLESVRGSKVSFDVGTLAGGESRTVVIPCVTKTIGQQKCEVFAEADGGLKASHSVALNVVQPRLDLTVLGPKMRYEGKKATYAIKITNPGDAPASNVFVTKVLPSGYKFQHADNGGLYDEATRSVKWFIGELGPSDSREMKIDLLAAAQGEFTHKVIAHASRGMKAEQEFKSQVEGISAISMELIDTEDPVEVGTDTAYEIRIANTGTKAESDVKLICNLPPQLKLKGVSGPVQHEVVGSEIIFKPMPRLAPRADVVIKITVTAVAKGDARFRASLTTASIIEPVTKVEVTKIYAD
jgi:uncharacterized repeat protein (TIGR01451 family)